MEGEIIVNSEQVPIMASYEACDLESKMSEKSSESEISMAEPSSSSTPSVESTEVPEEEIDHHEPILNPIKSRFTAFPIEYPSVWAMYKQQLNAFWKAEEIDFSRDYDDFITLKSDEQHVIKMILAFFAASDGIVNFNLRDRFLNDVKIYEAQTTYTYQMMMENIHNEVYSLMLENLIKDPKEKEHLFNAIKTVPAVKKMADWAFKWIDSPKRFAYRLVAFAIIEGVFFSGAFATIFWLKKYQGGGKMFMPGLIKSNEFIARDEGMHTNFACLLYGLLEHKLSTEQIYKIMDEAVEISKNFATESIKCKLVGLNNHLMCDYIEHIADSLLVSLGYTKKYNKKNPFSFMETIGMIRKTNFFESRPTEYQAAFNEENVAKDTVTVLEDF